MATLQFLGATGCVTGSKYLLTFRDGERLMVDCGLFQGPHALRDRNWEPLPIDSETLGSIILTHAHLDHTGFFPRLAKMGFDGKVYASETTVDLCGILWPDSGKIQEEDAMYANKEAYTKHKPALPLYTEDEARTALRFLRGVKYQTPTELSKNFSFTLYPAGHILGSCLVSLDIHEPGEAPLNLLFSGDLGRYNQCITPDPTPIETANLMVVESTYGDRLHDGTDPKIKLAEVIKSTFKRGGTVIIPSFAVGRTQELLYILREMEEEKVIPDIPVFVDSPMASSVTRVLLAHPEEHDLEMTTLEQHGIDPLGTHDVTFIRSVEESKALNTNAVPKVIIASSGMCTGGRVLHHLRHRVSDPANTVLFVGYQAEGTLGRYLKDGARETKILGERVVVRTHIESIESFSAHADYNEELRWLSNLNEPPRAVFITHGEDPARKSLSEKISTQLKWKTLLPDYLQTFDLKGLM
jgi:metallo-beta-lactamase family protein